MPVLKHLENQWLLNLYQAWVSPSLSKIMGALAMHFFVQFHIAPIDLKDMDLVPDFSDVAKAAGYGIWGSQKQNAEVAQQKKEQYMIKKAKKDAATAKIIRTLPIMTTEEIKDKNLNKWDEGCNDLLVEIAANAPVLDELKAGLISEPTRNRISLIGNKYSYHIYVDGDITSWARCSQEPISIEALSVWQSHCKKSCLKNQHAKRDLMREFGLAKPVQSYQDLGICIIKRTRAMVI
ncbi:hypothetical protein M422DRAFT_274472 [Sphaerobolus stellatus SS14]|uniref:Uncharacterized protein n=1 Tax=Sphaerobolus stellatus (strain SS14) TaxID=990650 RepID=A0A0C9UGX8_SPHS4|nr:hypothetical protein M422DRAFT_274472 [Sphaerobolus stellatus SS14]